MRKRTLLAGGGALLAVLAVTGSVAAFNLRGGFGQTVQSDLNSRAHELFGVSHPIDEPVAGVTVTTPGTAAVRLAQSLHASVVSDQVKSPADQIALWPDDDHPQYTIACIEGSGAGHNGVQRVNIETGAVATILTGMNSCDPVRRTPWGTILVGEERTDGNAIEVLDPIGTTNQTVDRVAKTSSSPNIVFRPALGTLAFEGWALLSDGTVYAGDELKPEDGQPGGSIYKFVPAVPRTTSGAITDLSQSPYAAGSLYALRIGAGLDNPGAPGSPKNYGQGASFGKGRWVGPVPAATARTSARALGVTGYWRPEDIDIDHAYAGGFRACFTATGEASINLYGEVDCFTDGASGPEVEQFVVGTPEFTMPDNLAFQPGTGILYVLEDIGGVNNFNDDIWACLPDGDDADLLSDGCVRVAVNLDGAGSDGREGSEWSGMIFAGDGRSAFVHMQHRSDPANPLQTRATDDLLEITGFKVPGQ